MLHAIEHSIRSNNQSETYSTSTIQSFRLSCRSRFPIHSRSVTQPFWPLCPWYFFFFKSPCTLSSVISLSMTIQRMDAYGQWIIIPLCLSLPPSYGYIKPPAPTPLHHSSLFVPVLSYLSITQSQRFLLSFFSSHFSPFFSNNLAIRSNHERSCRNKPQFPPCGAFTWFGLEDWKELADSFQGDQG